MTKNTNVLASIQCPNPNCASLGPFDICGEAQFMGVTDDGCGEFEGMCWDDDSRIICCECGHVGAIGEFKVDDESCPVFKVWLQIEEIDEDHDVYENRGEPTSLGTFDTLEAAVRFFNYVELKTGGKHP